MSTADVTLHPQVLPEERCKSDVDSLENTNFFAHFESWYLVPSLAVLFAFDARSYIKQDASLPGYIILTPHLLQKQPDSSIPIMNFFKRSFLLATTVASVLTTQVITIYEDDIDGR